MDELKKEITHQSAAEDGTATVSSAALFPAAARPVRRTKKWRRALLWLSPLALLVGVGAFADVEYAYVPDGSDVLNSQMYPPAAFNIWERDVSAEEVSRLLQTEAGRRYLSPGNGAVAIDSGSLRQGRRAFYAETFGNEIFLTDVMGLLNGPIRPASFAIGIAALGGRGTTNLQVPLMHDATVGGRRFRRGEWVSTGIDVPRGVWVPLGMKLRWNRGHVQGGITCAACHSAVDPKTGKVMDGAPNPDFDPGLVMALASNSAAFFPHTRLEAWKSTPDSGQTVTTADGRTAALPDARALEAGVDQVLLGWRPGNFDSTVDLVSNPTQYPISWTRGNHPYSYSGVFGVGSFRGLSAQNNNVHALNADSTVQAQQSLPMFGVDSEVYLATVLQNAPPGRFRWSKDKGLPSRFFAQVDPTPSTPGMNQIVTAPGFPKGNYLSPDGTYTSKPRRPFWADNHAMSAWQDTLVPPPPNAVLPSPEVLRQGRVVFERVGCVSCHAGAFGSNNRVIAYADIGGESTRAHAFARTQRAFAPPVLYAANVPVPVPPGTRTLTAPVPKGKQEDLTRAWAHDGSAGGYKVSALTGLGWTAPYLHSGDVGVCADGAVGDACRVFDPTKSLRALVDRRERRRVTDATRADGVRQAMHRQGNGHRYWADAASGVRVPEQEALIAYLLWGFGSPDAKSKPGRRR